MMPSLRGGAMHRKPNGPRVLRDPDGLGAEYDGFLREQRERILRNFGLLAAHRMRRLREILNSTGYYWEPSRGNVLGSPGRGHYPRDGS